MPACGIFGQIGLSGRTEFPHLHLTSRKDQKVIDPFHPKDRTNCTTSDQTTLWKDPLHYRAAGLLSAGFSDAVPDYVTIKAGTASRSPVDARIQRACALGLWFRPSGGGSPTL